MPVIDNISASRNNTRDSKQILVGDLILPSWCTIYSLMCPKSTVRDNHTVG